MSRKIPPSTSPSTAQPPVFNQLPATNQPHLSGTKSVFNPVPATNQPDLPATNPDSVLLDKAEQAALLRARDRGAETLLRGSSKRNASVSPPLTPPLSPKSDESFLGSSFAADNSSLAPKTGKPPLKRFKAEEQPEAFDNAEKKKADIASDIAPHKDSTKAGAATKVENEKGDEKPKEIALKQSAPVEIYRPNKPEAFDNAEKKKEAISSDIASDIEPHKDSTKAGAATKVENEKGDEKPKEIALKQSAPVEIYTPENKDRGEELKMVYVTHHNDMKHRLASGSIKKYAKDKKLPCPISFSTCTFLEKPGKSEGTNFNDIIKGLLKDKDVVLLEANLACGDGFLYTPELFKDSKAKVLFFAGDNYDSVNKGINKLSSQLKEGRLLSETWIHHAKIVSTLSTLKNDNLWEKISPPTSSNA